jgi:hypothetical protein
LFSCVRPVPYLLAYRDESGDDDDRCGSKMGLRDQKSNLKPLNL